MHISHEICITDTINGQHCFGVNIAINNDASTMRDATRRQIDYSVFLFNRDIKLIFHTVNRAACIAKSFRLSKRFIHITFHVY